MALALNLKGDYQLTTPSLYTRLIGIAIINFNNIYKHYDMIKRIGENTVTSRENSLGDKPHDSQGLER